MVDPTLIDYVKKASASGLSEDKIRTELMHVGWDEHTIDAALSALYTAVVLPTHAPVGTVSASVTNTNGVDSHSLHRTFPFKAVITLLFFSVFMMSGGAYYFMSRSTNEQAIVMQAPKTNSATSPDGSGGFVTYTNEEYHFMFHMPDTWASKEFSVGAYGKEKRFAFGPLELLPKEQFTPARYTWIKIYPKSDSSNYNQFSVIKSQVGNGQVNSLKISGIDGIDTGTFFAVEKDGFVYEFHLIADQDSDLNFSYSLESKEIIASFTFL